MKDNIELISTEDLISEIMRRFNHSVFVGRIDRTANDRIIIRRWQGDVHTCSGLIKDADITMLLTLKIGENKIDPKDY